MKRNIALIIIVIVVSFMLGSVITFEYTMKNMKVLPENDGVVLIEIYGQEWIYEEDEYSIDRNPNNDI